LLPAAVEGGEERLLSVTCLSRRPFVFYLRNALDDAECAAIIARAQPMMRPSFVTGAGEGVTNAHMHSESDVDGASAAGVAVDEGSTADVSGFYRSSNTAWLPLDATLQAMQARLAAAMSVPTSFIQLRSEELQVVSYTRDGAQFRLHQDSSPFHVRHCTALFYLNDPGPAAGGETWFPYANGTAGAGAKEGVVALEEGAAADANRAVRRAIQRGLALHEEAGAAGTALPGVSVPPRRGDAVLFFNHAPLEGGAEVEAEVGAAGEGPAGLPDPDLGTLDPTAVHAGLPVKGDAHKWVANYWF
jgi:hypothetical protein